MLCHAVCHVVPTPGQPVSALILSHKASGRVATKVSIVKLLVDLNRSSGTGTSHDHLDLPRPSSYREQFKEGDEEADRGNDRKTSESGLALNGISYHRKPRTGRSGGSWL